MGFELEQQRRKIEQLEKQNHLRESVGSNPYPCFGQLITPIAQYYDGIVPIAAPAPTLWDATLGLGIYFTEALLDIIRAYARWFVASTPQANGVIESLTDYIVAGGFDYQIQPRVGERVAKDTLEKAQRIIDDFLTSNQWFETQVDRYRRLKTDGEWVPRLSPQDDGVTQLRTIEPWQVRGASTSPEQIFGVITKEGDRETIEGYNVTFSGQLGDAEVVPATEMSLWKRNTPKQAKRGVTDFLCLQGAFQQTMRLLSNSLQGESARQALLWIQETTGAANPVQQVNEQGTKIGNGPNCTLGSPGQFDGPQVATVDKNLQFKDSPAGASSNAATILSEGYRAISVYFRVPVWMIAGSSDNSFAQSLVENDPLAVMVKREQKTLMESDIRLLVQVLKIAEEQGELDAGTVGRIAIAVKVPPVVTRDKGADTERNKTLAQAGLIGPRSWSEAEELDYEEEQASIRETGPVQFAGDDANQRIAAPSTEPAATQARQAPHPSSKGGINGN